LVLFAPSGGLPPSSSGNASKAASSLFRPQTVRALIRFGFGMRQSFTMMSNSDGEIPMYAAAATRDSPRGGSEGGRISGGVGIVTSP
jgi:hypothetical protein